MSDEIDWAKTRVRAEEAVRSYVSPPEDDEEHRILALLVTAYMKGYRAGHVDGFASATRKESAS